MVELCRKNRVMIDDEDRRVTVVMVQIGGYMDTNYKEARYTTRSEDLVMKPVSS